MYYFFYTLYYSRVLCVAPIETTVAFVFLLCLTVQEINYNFNCTTVIINNTISLTAINP